MKKFLIVLAAVMVVGTVVVVISQLPGSKLTVLKEEMDAAAGNGEVINRQIEVNTGDTFVVSLYAQWSAGMKWSANLDDSDIGRHEGAREFTNDGPAFSIGSAGYEVWTFKTLKAGQTTITMTYNSETDLSDAPQGVNTLVLVVTVT